jgi:hypothetical protein
LHFGYHQSGASAVSVGASALFSRCYLPPLFGQKTMRFRALTETSARKRRYQRRNLLLVPRAFTENPRIFRGLTARFAANSLQKQQNASARPTCS